MVRAGLCLNMATLVAFFGNSYPLTPTYIQPRQNRKIPPQPPFRSVRRRRYARCIVSKAHNTQALARSLAHIFARSPSLSLGLVTEKSSLAITAIMVLKRSSPMGELGKPLQQALQIFAVLMLLGLYFF